jgi:type I restriction enzyme M protein
MNMVLHGVEDLRIEYGDVLSSPKLTENGKLRTYDKVLANFPFSMATLRLYPVGLAGRIIHDRKF